MNNDTWKSFEMMNIVSRNQKVEMPTCTRLRGKRNPDSTIKTCVGFNKAKDTEEVLCLVAKNLRIVGMTSQRLGVF
jgi:hypothetical protein